MIDPRKVEVVGNATTGFAYITAGEEDAFPACPSPAACATQALCAA